MRNYRMTLCYDGTRYRGWQKQANTDKTIQGKLETLLSRLLDQTVEVQGSGRTDAGVNARLMVAHFDTEQPIKDIDRLVHSLNALLPQDIAIYGITPVQRHPGHRPGQGGRPVLHLRLPEHRGRGRHGQAHQGL